MTRLGRWVLPHVWSTSTPFLLTVMFQAGPIQDVFAEVLPKQLGSRLNSCIIVFDVTDVESFLAADKWFDLVRGQMHTRDRPIIGALVGNKCDMTKQRKVAEHQVREKGQVQRLGGPLTCIGRLPVLQAREWASSRGLEYFETSAASAPGINYREPFMHVAREFHAAYDKKRLALTGQFS